jgi:acyl-homoserine-lactone acylase
MRFYSLLLLCFLSFTSNKLLSQNPLEIEIIRDSFGTPHIFGKTDADVAYGLAWANAEDAFEKMQEMILTGKGMMGLFKGKDGAAYDFFVHTVAAEETYQKYKNQIPADYLKYLEGYCKGINAYAKSHPKEVLIKKAFPIEPKDVIKTYIVAFSALVGTPNSLKNILNGKFDTESNSHSLGSNAYAFRKEMTDSGKTFLAINPHFKIDGPFSFYDAHLCSEEGMNIYGAMFQGGTCIVMGSNPYLGWGHTFNYMDQVDVFELDMKHKKSLEYKWNGKYEKLRKRPIWLQVKLGKSIVIPVKKMCYESVFGPTLKSPKGRFYALRSPAFQSIHSGEQYYRMGKSTNLNQFKNALRMDAVPLFNIVYADYLQNIYYLSNGIIPKRDTSIDYSQVVAAKETKVLWDAFYSLEDKPHVENPTCDYVYNMNNTPSRASCESSNFPVFKPDRFSDLRFGDNNRSTRFTEIIENKTKWSYEDFKKIKFDNQLSKNTIFYQSIKQLFQINPKDFPHVADIMTKFQNWNFKAEYNSYETTIVMLTMQYIFKKKNKGDAVFIKGIQISETDFIEALTATQTFLMEKYKTIEVPLQEIQFHLRNGKLHPAKGFPDMLSPAYAELNQSGNYVLEYGDTFIQFVKFGPNGTESIESLIPFENHKNCEMYKDELQLFNQEKLKTIHLEKTWNMRNAQRIYTPSAQK